MPQPNLGIRTFLGTRVPPELAEIIRDVAAAQGFNSVSDYLCTLAARDSDYDLPDLRTRVRDADQKELPLTA